MGKIRNRIGAAAGSWTAVTPEPSMLADATLRLGWPHFWSFTVTVAKKPLDPLAEL